MLLFSKFFLIIFFVLNFIFYDLFNINENFSIYNIFIFYFIFFISINFNINKKEIFAKFDSDIFYKFCYLLLKTPNYFLNYFLNTFNKIYLYLMHFKIRYLKNTFKILNKRYLSPFFLTWRPLFKKTSYFGYYRSNRSKWIK